MADAGATAARTNQARQTFSRRHALGGAVATLVAARGIGGTPTTRNTSAATLGTGGSPITVATVAALAKQIGRGEPAAIVDLAAVDQNCQVLLGFAARTGIAWRPAYKTLESPDLLAYVVGKLDKPRVMIHHLRTLPQAMTRLPAGTDFLMGYPPTLGELEAYVLTPPSPGEPPYTLRINVDSIDLLNALDALSIRSARPLPLDVVLELEDMRGGIVPGAELGRALEILRAARDRLRLGALLCYDTLAALDSNPVVRTSAAQLAQSRIRDAKAQIASQASDFIDVGNLIISGPGSANYTNWAGSDTATEFSAGSAVLYADYLDNGYDTAGLHKALYLCSPVLRLPAHTTLGLPATIPAGYQLALIKAGGWPTGNNPTLSKIIYPSGLLESSVAGIGYGRGANSSGMILAPTGSLHLGDYVVETCKQVMEGQDYFGALHATRDGQVLALWPTVSRWSGQREELA